MENKALSTEKTCCEVRQFCQIGLSDGHWWNENEAPC